MPRQTSLLSALLLAFALANPTAAAPANLATPAAKPAAKPAVKPPAKPAKPAAETKPADPVAEAVRVFRVETARLGVREGQTGVKRKSAGAGFPWHGRVYEYVRNNAFDAVPHQVVQNGGDRNILRRNQFGFSVSGPVKIPFLYDGGRKTFFTFSYEGTRERVGRSYLLTVPTINQRSGDFSDLVNKNGDAVTIYDQASTYANPAFDPTQDVSRSNLEHNRDPYPNNRIPESRLDPVALAAAQHYPLPNTDIGPYLQNNFWSNPSELNTPDGILAKVDHNLFERHKITVDAAHSRGFSGQPRIFDTAANPSNPDRDFLNRRIVLRETYSISPSLIYVSSFQASSQEIDTLAGLADAGYPASLGLNGVSGGIFPRLTFGEFYRMGSNRGDYYRNVWNTYSLSNSLSIRRGRHSWRFVGQLQRAEVNTLELDSPSGSLTFNTGLTGLPGITNTGSSYASYLLGLAESAEVTDQPQPSYLRRSTLDTTVTDEYEVSENLTATLSLSVDVETPRVEKYDRQSTIDPDVINPANGKPGALVFANRDGYHRGFQPTRVTFEPTLGFAWNPAGDRDTVIRSSFRLYYAGIPLRSGAFGTQGFSAVRKPLSSNKQLAPAIVLADGFPALDYDLPLLEGDAVNGADVDIIPHTSAQPRYIYATVNLERRLPFGVTFRAAARSYRGKNLLVGGSVVGLNRIPIDALQFRDQLNNEAFRADLRPFPQYQQFSTDNLYPGGRYLYDIGDFSVEKRTGNGLSFDFSYQLRRRYDDYSGPGVQNPFDRSSAWAKTNGARPRVLSLNYVYELPFGDGKPILNNSGVFGKIVGDWSVSGFTRWMSGYPLSLRPEFNNTGGIVPYLRVNSVEGVDPRLDSPSPHLWFNPAAFSHPDDFTIGNVPRTHPSLLTPNWKNHDLAVTKRVPISSEQSLELLFQTFNFLNNANWNAPDMTIGTAEAPNSNAGKIIGSRGGRVMQLGARYNF